MNEIFSYELLILLVVIATLVVAVIGLRKGNESGVIVINNEVLSDVEETITIISRMAKLALQDDTLVETVTDLLVDLIDYGEDVLDNGYMVTQDLLMEHAIEICKDANVVLTEEQVELVTLGLQLVFKFSTK